MRRPAKKALIAIVAIGFAFPLGHITYRHFHVPEVPQGTEEWRLRTDALARARVFVPNAPAIASLDLTRNPNDDEPFGADEMVECQYVPKKTTGTTPKFDCRTRSGEVIKVKYGTNPEIPGEVAATRLLSALGFAADHMSIVRRVRCFGCPRSPFRSRQVAEWFFIDSLLDRFLDYREYADFDRPAIERKYHARAFEAGEHQGWAWYELGTVDGNRGGASRADVDAFRLMAVFLAHWDNKASNQRLLCLDDNGEDGAAPCAKPLLMIQDAGATFGPKKVQFDGWNHARVWRTDKPGCWVSLDQMPYGGATFADVEISEEGRKLFASKLQALSEKQITDLFTSSNFPDPETGKLGGANVKPWVQAFQAKTNEIATRACAPSPSR